MIHRLGSDVERRKARLMFYRDDVFVIAHKVMGKRTCGLCLEEVFCSAERLANHLLVNEITMEEFIDFEIDDLESACEDKEAVFQVLTIAFVKLCALRKVNPLASEVASALVHRCQAYEDFSDVLGKLADAEDKLRLGKKRADLFNYELKTIASERVSNEQADQVMNEYVNATLDCDVDVIKNVLVSFTHYNEEHNHRYDSQQDALSKGYNDKLNHKEVTKIIIDKADFHNTTFGSMYDIHGNEKVNLK